MNARHKLIKQLHEARPVIAPSMLKCDFGNLHHDVALLESAGAEVLHLDVMDGHFVPNLSYGPMVIERLRELTNLPFDAHLMISNPDKYLDCYLQAGCNCITIHIEAVPEPAELLKKIREADVIAGIALNPGTPVSAVEPFLSECDMVLVMSVEPGFGGQTFKPVAIEKLQQLRNLGSADLLLSVDGGIGTKTITDVASVGADIFVAGSSIFDMPDYAVAISEMKSMAAAVEIS